MDCPELHIHDAPVLTNATLVMALTGWMDGGDVSTGTVARLIDSLDTRRVASIEPDPFYLYNFPGAMEVAALFRPMIRIDDGLVIECDMPDNDFYADATNNLVFFIGKEPNLAWQRYAECLFQAAAALGVVRIVFVGSFAGSVPHTREPRLYATVSDPQQLQVLGEYGVRPSNYDGPGSFSAYLMTQAKPRSVEMTSLVAEIPAYLQGTNPLSIEAVTRRVIAILGLPADLSELRAASDEWESQVTAAVEKDEELAANIRKLEQQYDDDLIQHDADEGKA